MTADQYNVMIDKKTEPPFTGKYVHETKDGIYVCSVCGNSLFTSDAKFDSGTGWPSFDRAVPEAVREVEDGTTVEIVCAKCGSHLGHVFNDGPTETQKRYCVNSVCLGLKPEDFKKGEK